MKRKNLLFFMTDQQRHDTLFAEVGGEPVAPTWTRLAQEGTHFTHAYTSCPLCVPARTSLATGLNPIRSKMVLNDLPGHLAQDHPSLHSMLHDAGYDVAHIGVNHISLKPPLRQSLDFSAWQDDESYASFAQGQGISVSLDPAQRSTVEELCEGAYRTRPYSNAQIRSFDHDLSLFKDVWFADRAIDYIEQVHERPFALFVCLWAPHPPLVVPPSYAQLFPADLVTLPPFHGMPSEREPANRRRGAAGQLGALADEGDWKKIWGAHYALTRLADDQLNRIMGALEATGLLDDTLVVCTCDHGEQLGEHLMYQKMEMYEGAVRIPALFFMPSSPPSRQSVPISHLNFVPTILDLLEIPAPRKFEARSLAPSIREGVSPHPDPVYAAYSGNHAIGDIRRMIVADGFKYVWDGQEGELYALGEDPCERINLSGDGAHEAVETRLHDRLAAWATESGDWVDYTRRH